MYSEDFIPYGAVVYGMTALFFIVFWKNIKKTLDFCPYKCYNIIRKEVRVMSKHRKQKKLTTKEKLELIAQIITAIAALIAALKWW